MEQHHQQQNPGRQATFKDILASEPIIQNQTYDNYGKWFIKFAQAQDVLLRLSYLKSSKPDINSPDYFFYLLAHDLYCQIPLSLRSCSLLMEKGYYTDSLNLFRSMLESLVKCKYFLAQKDKVESFEKSNGMNIRISDMWDYVAGRDSYNKLYKPLSRFEHKNFGTALPRLNARLDSEGRFSLIPLFHKELAQIIINHLLYLTYAYLKLAPALISYEFGSNADLLKEYNEITDLLRHVIDAQKNQFPEAKEFYDAMEKIMN